MRSSCAIWVPLMGCFVSNAFSQVGEASSADFPPKKFEASRYDVIWKKNPFTLQVAAVGESNEDAESWAKGYVLRSVTRVSGKYMVHIENTTPPKAKDPIKGAVRYHRLTEDQPSTHGLMIVRVKAHRDPSQVEVIVGKQDGGGVKEAMIKYDPRALVAKPAARQRARAVVRPGAPIQAASTSTAAQQGGRMPQGATQAARGRRGGQAGSNGTQGTDNATSERRVVLPPGSGR